MTMNLKKNTTKLINLRRQRNINNVISVTFSSLSLLFYSYSNLPVSTFLYFFFNVLFTSLIPSFIAAIWGSSTGFSKIHKMHKAF